MAADSKPMGVNPDQLLEDVDFEDDEQVTRVMRRAIAGALRSHKEKGQYIVEWRDGKTVRVEPEDIVVPEVE